MPTTRRLRLTSLEALGEAAYIGRCRVVPLRNTGAALSPHSAFLVMQGLETLVRDMIDAGGRAIDLEVDGVVGFLFDFLIDFMDRHREEPFFAFYSMALCHDVTDDLDEPVPFDNEPGSEAPLYQHLVRAIEYTLERLGPHGLPLIGRLSLLFAVSQFTLAGSIRKGRRPSFDGAMAGHLAEPLFERFVELVRGRGIDVETGVFGAMMDVELVNDGPVTLLWESSAG